MTDPRYAYFGIGPETGKVVPEDEAADYALAQITGNPAEEAAFIEWFYSGNWRRKEISDEII